MANLKGRILKKLMSNELIWALVKRPAYWFDIAKANRFEVERERIALTKKKAPTPADIARKHFNTAKNIFPDLVVKNGPFKGMKYPDFVARGSSIFPKLLGSYEGELDGLLNELLKKSYSEVIDVGCAEGYYAIGFALKIPCAVVYAYDTDDVSRDTCSNMAKINGVEDRVHVNTTCTAATLKDFKFANNCLIICDCEGYEKQLFTTENIANLNNCDVLIEIHDFEDKHTGEYIQALFRSTHDIQIVDSLSDHLKVMRYRYPELSGLDYDTKYYLLEESRASTMEWYFFSPKK